MPDVLDDTIQTLVTARERGVSRHEAIELVHEVYAAPWSNDPYTCARDLIERVFSRPRSNVPSVARTEQVRP